MKILIIALQFPPVSSGGVAYVSFNLYRAFRQFGHTVNVLAYGSKKPFRDYPGVIRLGTSPVGFLYQSFQNRKSFDLLEFDTIFIQGFSSAGLIPKLKKLQHCNIVSVIHVSTYQEMKTIRSVRDDSGLILGKPTWEEYHTKYIRSPVLLVLEHYVYKNSHKMIGVSNATTQSAIIDYGIHPSTIKTIRNGVDFERFSYQQTPEHIPKVRRDGHKLLLFVGILRRIRKGVYLLLEFYRHLKKETKDIDLVIVGNGNHNTRIQKIIHRSHLNHSINVIGNIDNDDLAYIYSQADVTIVPSLYEGLPLVALESLACGTPVAATDIACHREIINEKNGVLLATGNPVSWRDEILNLLNRKIDREQVKNSITHLNWNSIAQAYLNWAKF